MSQPHDPDVDPVGDDYSEPEYDGFGVVEDEQPEQSGQTGSSGTVSQPEGYAPFDISDYRPSEPEAPKDEGLYDEDGNPLPTFDDRYKDDFEGLAFLGALSKTFEWLGHRFTIRTLMVDEALHVSALVKEYQNTIGDGLAYRTAMAAMCVTLIDGKALPMMVGDEGDYAYASERFRYARTHWFQATVDTIYNHYLELEFKTRQVVDAMGKASGLTASTPG